MDWRNPVAGWTLTTLYGLRTIQGTLELYDEERFDHLVRRANVVAALGCVLLATKNPLLLLFFPMEWALRRYRLTRTKENDLGAIIFSLSVLLLGLLVIHPILPIVFLGRERVATSLLLLLGLGQYLAPTLCYRIVACVLVIPPLIAIQWSGNGDRLCWVRLLFCIVLAINQLT